MCGIAGSYTLYNKLPATDFSQFIKSLRHRGPDGIGEFRDEKCWLGHTRLSIIDRSNNGSQPMTKPSKGNRNLTIIFNGEIYNYQEIRSRLSHLGYHFESTSDTEVVLHAYAEWGEGCLNMLNGMWAMAIYDNDRKNLFLSRDRFGVKPMYIYVEEDFIHFASEAKAFRYLPDGRQIKINKQLINLLGERSHSKQKTLHIGINRLPSGHNLLIKYTGKIVLKKWWDNSSRTENLESNIKDLDYTYEKLFEDCLRLRLRSEAKTCTALSGGIDSSSVLSMIYGKELLNNCSNTDHKAFVLNFNNTAHSEKKYAQSVIDKYSIKSTIIDYSKAFSGSAAEMIEKCIYHSEQFRSLFIGPYLLYKGMSEEGYKVSIDGHGADELLAGYGKFMLPSLLDVLSATDTSEFDEIRNTWIEFGKPCPTRNELIEKYGHLTKIKKSPSYLFQKRYKEFYQDNLPWILDTYDKIPMAHGVEVRSPFLDWRHVRFSLGLSANSLLGGGFTKKILRNSMKKYLPKDILHRKKKLGFGTPYSDFVVNTEVKEMILDTCNSQDFTQSAYTDNQGLLKKIEEAYSQGDYRKVSALWPYLQLHFLLKSFTINKFNPS